MVIIIETRNIQKGSLSKLFLSEGGFGGDEDVVPGGDEEGGGWDVDDDLELPADLEVGPTPAGGDEGYFVPPTKGTSQSQVRQDKGLAL